MERGGGDGLAPCAANAVACCMQIKCNTCCCHRRRLNHRAAAASAAANWGQNLKIILQAQDCCHRRGQRGGGGVAGESARESAIE